MDTAVRIQEGQVLRGDHALRAELCEKRLDARRAPASTKAKLCGKNDGIAWLQQVFEEAENVDLTPGQVLALDALR